MTRFVGTRISAQVRSHAQKVLKDYSPKNQPYALDDSKSEMTEPPHHETISLPRDLTTRTHDHNFGVNRLEIEPGRQGTTFNGDIADCLAKNFAQARKRYRKTSGDTIDLG